MRAGGWRFRAGLAPSIAAAAFIALTISLGNWQARRADEKLDAARKLDEAMQGPVLSIPSSQVDPKSFERRRVSARGRFIARATFFLDNRVLHGRAGYRVLTPLALPGGNMHVLVDRGWIAAGDRSSLPAVVTPEDVLTVEGIAGVPSRRFLELAPEESGSARRQNLVIEREQERLGVRLQPLVIEQTSDVKDGLQRSRELSDTGVERHQSYALQWYSFAALAALLYVVLNLKRIRPGDR